MVSEVLDSAHGVGGNSVRFAADSLDTGYMTADSLPALTVISAGLKRIIRPG